MLSVKHYKQPTPPGTPHLPQGGSGLEGSPIHRPQPCFLPPRSSVHLVLFLASKALPLPLAESSRTTGSGERAESLAELGGQSKDKPYRPGAWDQHLIGIPSGPQMEYMPSEMSPSLGLHLLL